MKFNIYILKLNDTIVYIGKSINFKERLKQHTKDKVFNKYALLECATEADMHVLEIYLITLLNPKFNKDCVTLSDPSFKLPIGIDNLKFIDFESEAFKRVKKSISTSTIDEWLGLPENEISRLLFDIIQLNEYQLSLFIYNLPKVIKQPFKDEDVKAVVEYGIKLAKDKKIPFDVLAKEFYKLSKQGE